MRPEFKYGLLTGLGVSVLFGLGHLLGNHGVRLALGQYGGLVSSLILLAALFPLLRLKAAMAADGRLSWGQGIYSGLLASMVAAVIVCSLLIAYNQYFNPFWLDNALDWRVAQLRAAGITEIEIRREITFQRLTNSAPGLVGTTLLGMTLMGAIFSVALTFFLRSPAESARA